MTGFVYAGIDMTQRFGDHYDMVVNGAIFCETWRKPPEGMTAVLFLQAAYPVNPEIGRASCRERVSSPV